MYKIKQIPEDFCVKEINNLEFDENGEYSYYLIKKKNLNTQDVVDLLVEKWKIKEKNINFAGTKDKIAITEQYFSILNGPEKEIDYENKEKNENVSVKFIGKGKKRLCLGELSGNYFEIIVRNIIDKPKPIKKIKNYFDEQRFGVNKNNDIVGKLILKRKFKEACELIGLETKNNDFVGALRTLPKKTLKIYINAYQSHLFNYLIDNIDYKGNEKAPLIGFGTEETKEIKEVLKKENISLRDFIIREIPDLSSDGDIREVYVNVDKLEIGELDNDELNEGKKKCFVKFNLQKGSYATIVIKTIFS